VGNDARPTRALVTGRAGFIGHHLVRRLISDGHEVCVLDNFATGRRERLEGLDLDLVEGDLRSYERAHAAVRGAELVFHLGALPSVPRSVQDPLTTGAVNVEGTLNVLLAARDEGVRRVVFASSLSVYGASPKLPKTETDQPLPISPYGVSKVAAEHYCRAFATVYGLETVVSAFSTCSVPARTRCRSTRPWFRASSRHSRLATDPSSTGMGPRHGISRTSRTW
jgi:UDP-glucose 4-epimerase